MENEERRAAAAAAAAVDVHGALGAVHLLGPLLFLFFASLAHSHLTCEI